MMIENRLEKIIPIFLIVSAFLGVSFSYGKVYSVHLAILAAAPLFVYTVFKNKNFIEVAQRNKFLLIWLIYFGVSLAWAENINNGVKYFTQLLLGISTAILTSEFSDKIKTFKYLFYLLIITIIVSLFETFTDFRFPISKYSDILHFFKKTALESDINKEYPTAFFWTPNNLTYVLLLALPFVTRIKKYYLQYILPLLIILLTLRASSRGILIIVILYLAYKLVTSFKEKLKVKNVALVLIPLIVLIVASKFMLSKDNLIELKSIDRIVRIQATNIADILTNNIENKDAQNRRGRMLYHSVEYIKQSPIIGNGVGYLNGKVVTHKNKPLDLATPHFYWIELIVQGGFVFFLFLLYFVFQIIKKSKGDSTKREVFFLLVLGAPACSTLIYFFPTWMLLGLICSNINFTTSNEITN